MLKPKTFPSSSGCSLPHLENIDLSVSSAQVQIHPPRPQPAPGVNCVAVPPLMTSGTRVKDKERDVHPLHVFLSPHPLPLCTERDRELKRMGLIVLGRWRGNGRSREKKSSLGQPQTSPSLVSHSHPPAPWARALQAGDQKLGAGLCRRLPPLTLGCDFQPI